MEASVRKLIGNVFNQIADGLETGTFARKTRVGITTLGNEHGVMELVKGAEMAAESDPTLEVVLIGPGEGSTLETVEVKDEHEMHDRMEQLLDSGAIDCCVTQHYNFPIGVSTVGKVVTPGAGREMYLATTTGTSAVNRVEAMVRNAVYGIAVAKAMGNMNPTVGILNLDGARQVERILLELKGNGYGINFSESLRKDGGYVMRGNDLLAGTPDIMVTDTLTGNLLMKIFSSYTTGGDYEAVGYGYGPGVGDNYSRIILILSRASGAPVAANAIKYAARLARGELARIVSTEMAEARKAGLDDVLLKQKKDQITEKQEGKIEPPPKKVVTASISGIDIMDLDNAVEVLWKNRVYAETGMGCTGPVVLVAEEDLENAGKLLAGSGYVTKEVEC
ncbi:MAG: Glycine/sarcosine/betaine reductase component C chain 2 [Firmicutes bacterium]|nr:Glycine/sarcosine/betaine reductase component C chain 2 [Bacillota bacterium]MDI6704960.1 glycine/sarcosine/betaine reductase complex component C subunit alpha [Bacillota bacterium]